MRLGAMLVLVVALAGEGQAETLGLTRAEAAAFRAAVGACWLHDPAAPQTVVTLRFGLDRAGRVAGEVTMVRGRGGAEADIAAAFALARAAVLDCEGEGYPLPPEKHEFWREVELTFDPRIPLG